MSFPVWTRRVKLRVSQPSLDLFHWVCDECCLDSTGAIIKKIDSCGNKHGYHTVAPRVNWVWTILFSNKFYKIKYAWRSSSLWKTVLAREEPAKVKYGVIKPKLISFLLFSTNQYRNTLVSETHDYVSKMHDTRQLFQTE